MNLKSLLLGTLIFLIASDSYAQRFHDIITTINSQKIICKIDSLTSQGVYFTFQYKNVYRNTFLDNNEIQSVKFNEQTYNNSLMFEVFPFVGGMYSYERRFEITNRTKLLARLGYSAFYDRSVYFDISTLFGSNIHLFEAGLGFAPTYSGIVVKLGAYRYQGTKRLLLRLPLLQFLYHPQEAKWYPLPMVSAGFSF